MIDLQKRILFIQIQKTGCSSVFRALRLRGWDHRYLRSFEDCYDLSRFFKFSFVRNPFDRLVSAYFYRKQGGCGSAEDMRVSRLMPNSFHEFCMRLRDDRWDYRIYGGREQMFDTQFSWIRNIRGEIGVDFVGKFERMKHDFDKLCDALDIARRKLPHTNRSRHRPYRTYYTRVTRNIVGHRYADDIETFGYEF